MNLEQSVPGRKVQDTWYRVRNLIADMRHTLPAGTIGPFFNDRFGDTFGIIYGFTSDGFSRRELRDHVEAIRSRLLLVPDVSKIEVIGAQDERIFVEFSVRELANLGIDRQALVAALQSQNLVRPAGVIQTRDERLSLRVSGAFSSEADLLNVNFPVGDRMVRLADIATVRRGSADPPQPMFRVNGRGSDRPRHRHARGRRHPRPRREHQEGDGGDQRRPAARHRGSPRRRPGRHGRPRDRRFHDLAVAIRRHHPGRELHQPRRAARPRRRALDSADACDRLRGNVGRGHRHAADLARRPHHRARAPRRRRDDDDGCDGDPARRRRRKDEGRDLRLQALRDGDARRNARHHRRFRPDRFRGELGRRIHLLALRRRHDRPRCLVVRRGRVRAGARRRDADGAETRIGDRRTRASGARSSGAFSPRR